MTNTYTQDQLPVDVHLLRVDDTFKNREYFRLLTDTLNVIIFLYFTVDFPEGCTYNKKN